MGTNRPGQNNPNINSYGEEEPDKELKERADNGDAYSRFQVALVYPTRRIGPVIENSFGGPTHQDDPDYNNYRTNRNAQSTLYFNLAIDSYGKLAGDDAAS